MCSNHYHWPYWDLCDTHPDISTQNCCVYLWIYYQYVYYTPVSAHKIIAYIYGYFNNCS